MLFPFSTSAESFAPESIFIIGENTSSSVCCGNLQLVKYDTIERTA